MKFFQEVLADNPLMAKALKPFREFNGLKQLPSSTWIVIALIAMLYLVIVGGSLRIADFIDASIFLYIMLTIVILVCATVLHGALAGEREKRTIDLLLVAPVTARQIVTAKLFKVVIPALSVIAFCSFPSVVLALVRSQKQLPATSVNSFFPLAFVGSIAIVLSVVVMVTGVTLLVSSVNRTTANALTATLGAMFLWLVVLPVFATTVGVVNSSWPDALLSYHPFFAMTRLLYPSPSDSTSWNVFFVCILPHLAIGVLALIATSRNLEKERKTGARHNA